MEKFWLISCIAVLCVHLSNTFILPLKKPDGTLDTEHVVGHLTLLEQLVNTLQQTVASQGKDITALTTEISNLKATQVRTGTKISDLQKQTLQTSQVTAEVTSLKDEVTAAKTEIRLVSNEAISLTSQLNNVTHNVQTLSARVNSKDATRDVELMALNQKYQTLSSQVNSTGAARDVKLKALDQKYQILLAADKNMTVIVDNVKGTLTQVMTEVHSAQTDIYLLHNDVTRLNKSISATTMKLSAKIAEEHTEVGFESWIGSSIVTNGLLKFGVIQFNNGGRYNASTGKFTAPVSGTYLFWTQVAKTTGSSLTLYIKKTDTPFGYFYSSSTGYVTGFLITTTYLTVNQQVYVEVYGAQRINTGYNSRFGGILLYRH